MKQSPNGIPSATRLLAESVRKCRDGFPGIARGFLPVFAIFAFSQIGLALWGEAATFGGLAARALTLAGALFLGVSAHTLATAGVASSVDSLSGKGVCSLYRAGASIFWSVLWSTFLILVAVSAAPLLAGVLIPYVIQWTGALAAIIFGATLDAALLFAVAASSVVVIAAAATALTLIAKFSLVFPVIATGSRRGLAALEASAGLSEGRSWTVGSRLSVGFASVAVILLPFLSTLIATSGVSAISGAPWAWSLFVAAYLLLAVPFGAVFLVTLAKSLEGTQPERAVARASRPWVRWSVWAGFGVWGLLLLKLIIA